MSLIRQVWLLLLGMLVVALLGSVAIHALTARQSLRTQLQVRNNDGAMMLALALSQQRGDVDSMQLVAAAQFDTGNYRALRILDNAGRPLFERETAEHTGVAPDWFARWLPIDAAPGSAIVSDGWQPLGSVRLSSQAAWAVDALWSASLAMAGWLTVLGVAAAALAMRLVQSWRRPLDAAVAQAQALQERRFVLADEPRVPELRRLTRSMNSMVLRLQDLFAGQAAQLEDFRKLALADAVTGLANRRQFMTLLSSALGAERQRGAGLLLVRLRDLTAMNQRIGHDGTNRLLAALADVLQAYPQRADGALVGRLNGSDFALYLPAPKLARDTALSLIDALRAALATVDQGAELVIGGVDGQLPHDAGDALSQADAALARAEESGAFAVEVADGDSEPGVGEGEWRTRLVDALGAGRMRLAESAVRDAQGALVHLHCQTELRWAGAADFQPPARWLAMAVRCRLAAQVDLGALALALSAIASDGRPRCIAFSAASLDTPGFVASVVQRLQAAPRQAALLSIGFRESAARRNASRIAEACAAWRPLSVRSGLEQAGAALRELTPQLAALGIDYIRIDAAFVHDVARHGAVRDYARGLVVLLHGIGVRVLAEGVVDKDDLAELWTLQFDGAAGDAVSAVGG